MTAGYTKGEWFVHELGRSMNSIPLPIAEVFPSPPDTKIQIVTVEAPLPNLDTLEYTNEDFEISRANARLIAAAPDMYEALKEIQIQIFQNHMNPTYEIEKIIKKALLKAGG